ncbi:PLP-dependent aminotransferase family protein [Primorskyibacter sp. S87]|uniref:MocR-like pyridoxine biosynthesis transcription factor PdxR n=1 Tax=Primorskyibacter sp. S87 TaxID=3415126 RepID=UPI003C7C90D4
MKQAALIAFTIDRGAKLPVFEQICSEIRTRIISGDLRDGDRMPPTRAFATELGLSRSTIVTAYDQLVAEGYLTGLQGSGYTVCAVGDVELAPPATGTRPDISELETPAPRAFQAGRPDMRLFPHRQWARTVARICRNEPTALLASGGPLGHAKLRQAIARHVGDWRGIAAAPHQIVITAGSSDALGICLRALAKSGDGIGLEDPGYPPLRHYGNTLGLIPHCLPLDENGAALPVPGQDPKLVILTPSQQYPLGGAMSPTRRLEFIRWAKATKGWIIEDDYDSEFRYAGRPIPAMAGLDRLNRVIYVGSFSKIFSNALRIGYAILPETLLDRVKQELRLGGVHASSMPQQALANFICDGEFYRHLRRVRRIYGERRKFLIDRLSRDFACFGKVSDHQAGMQLVFHLTDAFRDREIAKQAAELGVEVDPLSKYCTATPALNGLVMGFCATDQSEISEGLDRLATVFNGISR